MTNRDNPQNPQNPRDAHDPQEAQGWAALVALNAVDPGDQDTVVACRAAHPDFDRWVAEFTDDAADLATPVAAPEGLRAQVLDAVGAETATSRSRGRSFALFAAAAVVVITLVISVVAFPFNDDATTDPVAQSITERTEVAGGTVELDYVPGSDSGTVRLTSVPAPKPGTAYQMWIVRGDDPASAGVMETEDVTPSMSAEVDGLENAREFMISLEPAGGSSTPSGDTLVNFALRA